MDRIKIIAVDFDGTLCTDCYPGTGIPNLPLIEMLKKLKDRGVRVILWTCRCEERLQEAVDWCMMFGLQFDAVNENLPEIVSFYGTDSRKIYADVYLDDKSCFPWLDCVKKTEETKNDNN